jgi:hypothetical protein
MGQDEVLSLIEQAEVDGERLQEMPGAIAILEGRFSLSKSIKKKTG